MAQKVTLPLMEAQLLQKEIAQKQPNLNLVRDHEVDKQLCLAYQQGSNEAGVELIYRYIDKLSYIYRFPTRTKNRGGAKCKIDITTSTTKEDKEDLFQEIVYHFLKLLLEYDPEEGDLQGLIIGKLHLRVFFYHYGDLVDIRMNEGELDDNYDIEEEMKEIFLEEKEVPEDIRRVYLAIGELTPPQREILDKTVVKGWTFRETATEMGKSIGYISKEKTLIMRKLKNQLEAI